jgi:membrane dipeptidase
VNVERPRARPTTATLPVATPETLALHHSALVFDCLALAYVLDEPYTTRLVEAGVDAINVTIAAEDEGWDDTLRLTEASLDKIERSPLLTHALCAADVSRAKEDGKIAVVLGTQGATMLGVHLWRLEMLYRLGFRYFAPAYSGASVFADGCAEFRDAGLSVLGRELVECANDLGMIIDLSHCGHRSRQEAADLALYPVCTHSNAYSVTANDRNTKDETIRAIASKGGVIGICGLVRAVWPDAATLDHMLNHVEHIVGLVGHEHVGMGLDFTEAYQEAFADGRAGDLEPPPKWRTVRPDIFGSPQDFYKVSYPEGLESVRSLPNLTQGLRDRDFDEHAIRAILGSNWLRNLQAAAG